MLPSARELKAPYGMTLRSWGLMSGYAHRGPVLKASFRQALLDPGEQVRRPAVLLPPLDELESGDLRALRSEKARGDEPLARESRPQRPHRLERDVGERG